MNRIIFAVLAALFISSASAQSPPNTGGMVPNMAPGMINGALTFIGTGVTPVACPYSQTAICFQTSNSNLFAAAWFDGTGNLTRTFDQISGRMDLRSNSAAGSVQGPPMVLTYVNSAPANNDVLGHLAWRGSDTVNLAVNQNTFAYINSTATTVLGTGSNLNSKMQFGVMVNQTAGAGNAQPNTFVTWDGVNFTSGAAAFFGTSVGTVTFGSANTSALTATSIGLTTNLPTKIAQEQVSNKTANYSVSTTDCGTVFTTISAAGEVDFTLPPTPGGSGCKYTFMVNVAQVIKVIANTGQRIACGAALSSSAGNVTSSVSGNTIEVIWLNSATAWQARTATGAGGSSGCGGWTAASLMLPANDNLISNKSQAA